MVLLEREAPLAELERALAQAVAGQGSVVAVMGEAGIGKSTLLDAFAVAARQSARVLVSGCEALFTPRPLGPLYDLAGDLGVSVETPRERLFPEVLASIRRTPTLVIVEDVHWADRATLDLLKYLGRRIGRAPALLAISYRDDEIGAEHPLISLLGDVAVRRIHVDALSVDAVEKLGGSREVYELTCGNPFYVREVLATGGSGVPPTVRDAVLARFGKLDEESRLRIEIASLIPGRAELAVVDGAPAESSGIIRVIGDAIVFSHELARLAIEQSIPDMRRTAMHRVILDRLAQRGERSFARLAHHAAGAREASAILRFAPLAAAEAAKAGSHREAAAHLRIALQYVTDVAERARLLESFSYECYLTEQTAVALECREEALAIWRSLGDTLREGDNLRWRSRFQWFLGQNKAAWQSAEEAIAILEPLPPGRELAMAYSNMSQLHMLAGDAGDAVSWGNRAIELAEQFDDYEILAHALNNVGVAENSDKVERSLRIALEHSYEEHAARAYTNISTLAVRNIDYERAARWLDEGIAYCRDRDLDSWVLYMRAWRARLNLERGDWDAGAVDAQAVLGHRGATAAISRIPALAVLGRIRMRRGDPGAMELLDEAHDLAAKTGEFQRIAPVAAARAEAAWLRGDFEAAKAEARAALEMPEGMYEPWARQELALFTGISRADFEAAGRPYEAAVALSMRGDVESLQRAAAILERLGDATLLLTVRQKLRTLGIRGPRESTRSNPAGLTAREIEIVQLIEEGLRNADIAGRLFVSPKTIDHHVSSILAKLGAKNRHEAARIFRSQHGERGAEK